MFNSTGTWRRLIPGLLVVIVFAITAQAAVIDDLTRDFAPVSGCVVMSEGAEYIIDLDESHGIFTGDIFSVIAPGERIVHPVTQKILGTLEAVKGILKVTRIKPGFSFARPVGATQKIARGDPIRRYSNLSAVFWDYTGQEQAFFLQLQQGLPDLKWQDYQKAQISRPPKPTASSATPQALTFILSAGSIEVRDPDFTVLRTYDFPASASKTGAAPAAAAGAGAADAAAAAQKLVPTVKAPPAGGEMTDGIKSVFPDFGDVQTLASLPRLSVIADFVKNGDQMLMASTDGTQIQVFDVADGLKLIAGATPPYPVQILAVKWWAPETGRLVYLAATIWSDRDKQQSGCLFSLDGNSIKPVIENIPRILGTFDLNGDGQPEALFGQEFDAEVFFGGRVDELALSGHDLRYSRPPIELPRHFPVLGSVFADLTGNGRLETAYVRNRILYIYSGKKRLYKSNKQMGGGLSRLTYAKNPFTKDLQPASAEFEIAPVAADLDNDRQLELVAVASDRDLPGSLSISPGIKKTWLSVFKYQDDRFINGTLGDELDLALPGLAVTASRILLVATEPGNLAGESAKSHLISYSRLPK